MDIEDSSAKLIDVARLANCSPATVSRVLNGNPTVNDVVRERVVQAARDLGYVPNGSARALRSTRTRLVGAIIPTLDHAIYATMVDGLQARLAEKDVSLIINTSTYDIDLEYEQARLLVFKVDVVGRGVDDQRNVLFGKPRLETIDHRGIDRVIQCRDDRADQPCPGRPQRPGGAVRHVAEIARRLDNAFAHDIIDGGIAVEDARDGGRRTVRKPRHVDQFCAAILDVHQALESYGFEKPFSR